MNESVDLTGAAASGVESLFHVNELTTVLVLIILALAWYVRYLILRTEKQGDRITDALIQNTGIISELKEMIRAALNQKN